MLKIFRNFLKKKPIDNDEDVEELRTLHGELIRLQKTHEYKAIFVENIRNSIQKICEEIVSASVAKDMKRQLELLEMLKEYTAIVRYVDEIEYYGERAKELITKE